VIENVCAVSLGNGRFLPYPDLFNIVLAFVFKKQQTVPAIDEPYIGGTSFSQLIVNIFYFSVPWTGLNVFQNLLSFRLAVHKLYLSTSSSNY